MRVESPSLFGKMAFGKAQFSLPEHRRNLKRRLKAVQKSNDSKEHKILHITDILLKGLFTRLRHDSRLYRMMSEGATHVVQRRKGLGIELLFAQPSRLTEIGSSGSLPSRIRLSNLMAYTIGRLAPKSAKSSKIMPFDYDESVLRMLPEMQYPPPILKFMRREYAELSGKPPKGIDWPNDANDETVYGRHNALLAAYLGLPADSVNV